MHRLKHEGKRCFRCQICSATFTSFGEYKHHMRVSRHIIRKPRIYECKTCGAMFTNSGNLIVHLRSLNHEASELANYFQSRWGVPGRWPPHHHLLRSHLDQKNDSSLDSNTWGSFDHFCFYGLCIVFSSLNGCNWLIKCTWSIWLYLLGIFNFRVKRIAEHFGNYSVFCFCFFPQKSEEIDTKFVLWLCSRFS